MVKEIMGKFLILLLILGVSQLEGIGNFDCPGLKSDLDEGEA